MDLFREGEKPANVSFVSMHAMLHEHERQFVSHAPRPLYLVPCT